ncbi:MAG: hypothetical protein WAV04_02800 [Candidatus Microsaccharimonas sp.]
MRTLRSGTTGSQEMFEFDGRLRVSREFSSDQAGQMAIHRAHRVGEFALTEATRGFRRRVAGLWVPHSATENNAITTNPEGYMNRSAELIKDKVFEKYLNDNGEYSVAETRLAIWAQFAANGQRSAIANKYESWRVDGKNKAVTMNPGFSTEGYVDRAFVESSPVVMGSIAAYMADLKSYIGHPDMMHHLKRTWIQDGHRLKKEEHLERTQQFLRKEPDWEFDRWFAESYYNHRSRAKFWYGVIQKSIQMREDILAQKRIKAWKEDMERRGYDV